MKHLAEFFQLDHNVVLCCDDTRKRSTIHPAVLFGNNLSQELFEFAKVVGHSPQQLKQLLVRNAEAIFDEESKAWLKEQIEKFRC